MREGLISSFTLFDFFGGFPFPRERDVIQFVSQTFLKERRIPFSILFAWEPRIYEGSGYKLMQNQIRFLDSDGGWKTFVYQGGMYAELMGTPWPNQVIDLCGPVV